MNGVPQAILRKKTKAGGIKIPNFKQYYKAIAIKTVQYWHKNRYIDQGNRIESPEANRYIYGQIVLDKGAKATQRGKDNPLNKCMAKRYSHAIE